MPEPGLILDGLCIEHGGQRLIELDVRIPPGECLTLMGPSGIGKSTVLAAITGTLAPDFRLSGRILLDGEDITHLPTERRHVGILFQDELLFPHLSVAGNLAFGLPAAVPRPKRGTRVEAALAEVDLEGFGPRDPATLSGGQKARVALMRMLLSEPRALLLDEPFSGLDAALRDQTRRLVFDLARTRGLPTLLVTHDAADAEAAGGRVITLG
jgi:putative thiamine transport system ATP-binding protein